MATESVLVNQLAEIMSKENKIVVKELHVPIIHQIYYDDYLEGREYIRIDLAAYDPSTDEIIFVEAENGLWLHHPQIYLPFCNRLYVLCPFDDSSYREEQKEWSKSEGIGILERRTQERLDETLEAEFRNISPAIKAFVISHILKKNRRMMKNA